MENIEIIFIATDQRNASDYFGYEVWIDFLDWHIVLSIKENDESVMGEDIRIMAKQGSDVTDDFFMFKGEERGDMEIAPTGMNLYQVMDVLKVNYNKERGKDY